MDDKSSRSPIVAFPQPADLWPEISEQSEAQENGYCDTAEGDQENEDSKQVLSKGHALTRMQYD